MQSPSRKERRSSVWGPRFSAQGAGSLGNRPRKGHLSRTEAMSTRLAPTNIQAIGPELAVAWNDGTESYLPLEALRRACPCAACGGEPDVLGRVLRPDVTYTPASFELRGFAVV